MDEVTDYIIEVPELEARGVDAGQIPHLLIKVRCHTIVLNECCVTYICIIWSSMAGSGQLLEGFFTVVILSLYHLQDVDSDRPILIIGDAVFHGQHRQIVGTAVVVAPPSVDASGSASTNKIAEIVAVTSRSIVFKLASGRLDTLLSFLAPGLLPPPTKKAKGAI